MSQFITTELLNVGLVIVTIVLKVLLWMDLLQDNVDILPTITFIQTRIVIIIMEDILGIIIHILIVSIIIVVGIGNMEVSSFLEKHPKKLIIQQQAF